LYWSKTSKYNSYLFLGGCHYFKNKKVHLILCGFSSGTKLMENTKEITENTKEIGAFYIF
jgi:hypothetical protein